MLSLTTFHHTELKRITVIKLRNKNEQNVISYSRQLRKSNMSRVKKFQTFAIYILPMLYLTSYNT